MAQPNTPPSTNSSSHSPASPDPSHRIVRKRNRVPLSCAPCRSRKLKCNRAHPCDNCIKRGDTTSCAYAQPGNRLRKSSSNGFAATPDEMQGRIDRLESLVLSLMTNGSQAPGPTAAQALLSAGASTTSPSTDQSQDMSEAAMQLMEHNRADEDSEIEAVSKSIGVMKVQNDRQFFASDAHWWTILSDIAEVKNYFSEHKKQYDEQFKKVQSSKLGASVPGSSLLFKGTAPLDQSEILVNFPSRPVANALIQRYFDSESPAARILHGPTFKSEYERHWNNPQATSTVWLGMCFAMMSLALQSYHRAGDEPHELRGKSREQSLQYLEWTAQCLVSSDFTQPTNYMLETLCLYLQAEGNRSRDTETGVWILCGIVTRLAMRMGLHRDPAPYAALTAYQGEMRRRLWHFIRFADTVLSFQVGLPSLVRSSDTDTALPTNLYDSDFNVDTKDLPPSRPSSECTPVGFMIGHCHFLAILGRIMEHSHAVTGSSYDDAIKLDEELNDARQQIPAPLRLKSREEEALDTASTIMERYILDLTYHRAKISLHRKYIARARDSSRYVYSRRECITSCICMLTHQATLHAECQPGRRLQSLPWSTASVVTMSDFLLAAMIICLDLYHTAQAETRGQAVGEYYEWANQRREDIFAIMESSVAVWETISDQSMEAFKASTVLKVMLGKLKNHAALRAQLGNNFTFTRTGGGLSPDHPEHSAAMTLGMMSSGVTPETMAIYDRPGYAGPPRTGMTPQPQQGGEQQANGGGQGIPPEGMSLFSNLFAPGLGTLQGIDMPAGMNFDWEAWDTYVQGSTGEQTMIFDPALSDGTYSQPQHGQATAWSPTPNHSNNAFAAAGSGGSS